jgi:hypothetical protein
MLRFAARNVLDRRIAKGPCGPHGRVVAYDTRGRHISLASRVSATRNGTAGAEFVKLKLHFRQACVAIMVEDASEWAVFLDLAGTLIDIAPTPRLVSIPPDLAPLLARLCVTLRGALAIVKGRQIVDVDRFLDPFRPIAAGVHGAQLRTERDGRYR